MQQEPLGGLLRRLKENNVQPTASVDDFAPPDVRHEQIVEEIGEIAAALFKGENELKAIARNIFHLRYGLFMQMVKEICALIGSEMDAHNAAEAIYTWAEMTMAGGKVVDKNPDTGTRPG